MRGGVLAKNKKNAAFGPLFMYVFLPLLAIGISSIAILKGVQNYITTSNYFKVRELKVEGITDKRYLDVMKEEILGGNIFRVDTRKLSERIRKKFPTFDAVTVARILPSQLVVTAKERLPVALLKRDLYYIFDTEGVALSSYASADYLDFPLITGLESRIRDVKLGAAYSMNILERPLALAKALKLHRQEIYASIPLDSRLKVSRIDASDLNNLVFYLGDDIQIKVGREDFEDRVGLFGAILRSIGAELSQVKYIDLRPKEPVVATKDNKKKKI